MNQRFAQLLKLLTPEEETGVETFTAAVLARREDLDLPISTDDISSEEILQLLTDSGSFDWLNAAEQDIYSPMDGKTVHWNDPQ